MVQNEVETNLTCPGCAGIPLNRKAARDAGMIACAWCGAPFEDEYDVAEDQFEGALIRDLRERKAAPRG